MTTYAELPEVSSITESIDRSIAFRKSAHSGRQVLTEGIAGSDLITLARDLADAAGEQRDSAAECPVDDPHLRDDCDRSWLRVKFVQNFLNLKSSLVG